MKKKLKSKSPKRSSKSSKKKMALKKNKLQKKSAKKKGLMKKLMGRLMKKKNKKVIKKAKPLKKKQKKLLKKKKPAPKKAAKKKMKVSTKISKVEKLLDATEAEIITSAFTHEPALVQEVLENLELTDKKTVVDGTLGLGGHAKSMLEMMAPDAKLIGFDVDDDNMATARENLKAYGERVVFVRSNFSNLQEELKKLGSKTVDALLLDLGLSSPQVDNPEKGFSFLREGALDMRFDKTAPLTAADVINNYSVTDLTRIFHEYGEERFGRKIAAEIGKRRKARTFKTTTELANFIEKIIRREGHIHPATRVFQALRIEVNHELDVLLNTLKQSVEVLKKGGRVAVISYHSLEDRVVKQFFKECARDYINEPHKLTTTHLKPTLKIVTKKPIVPTDLEIAKNPRSRSAKLRVAEKI